MGLVACWAKTKPMSHDEVLTLAASAESNSEHPIGQAVLSAARSRGLKLGAVSDFQATSGLGLECVVDGVAVHLGNRSWLGMHGMQLSKEQEAEAVKRESLGETRARGAGGARASTRRARTKGLARGRRVSRETRVLGVTIHAGTL